MTNFEKYQYALAKLMIDTATFGVSKVTGNIGACGDIKCEDCIFKKGTLCTCYQKAKSWANAEFKELILDEVEREYLSDVIRPFRERIRFIKKSWGTDENKERIWINFGEDEFATPFPSFKKGTMYKGMLLGKYYTVEDLGL